MNGKTTVIRDAALDRFVGRQRAPIPPRRRRRVHRRPHRPRRGPLRRAPASRTIDGSRRFVMPGLINLHSHPHTEPASKGVREDHGVPRDVRHRALRTLLRLLPRRARPRGGDGDGLRGAPPLRSHHGGGPLQPHRRVARPGRPERPSGLRRLVLSPTRTGSSRTGHELGFDWDEARGRRELEASIRIMDLAEQHPSGRLRGIVYPGQIETCTESTLRDAAAHARETGRPLTTHLSQSKLEFLEIVRRHGKTPPRVTPPTSASSARTRSSGHVIFIDEHPDIRWRTTGDLDRPRRLPGPPSRTAPPPSPATGTRWPTSAAIGRTGSTWGWAPTSPPTTSWRRCASPSFSPG